MSEDQLFYVGQKALIEKDGKILVLNSPLVGADLPGGKIQIGELAFDKSLMREIKEETSLEVSVNEPIATGYFKFHPQIIQQKKSDFVFIVVYMADYISGEVSLSDEHETYQWVSEHEYETIDDRNGLITKILATHFIKRKASQLTSKP
jgi:8-oxo-dGTP diphosphatase